MATKNVTIRATHDLISLMERALEQIQMGTAKKYTRNNLMVDAIEAFCRGVFRGSHVDAAIDAELEKITGRKVE